MDYPDLLYFAIVAVLCLLSSDKGTNNLQMKLHLVCIILIVAVSEQLVCANYVIFDLTIKFSFSDLNFIPVINSPDVSGPNHVL